MYFQRIDLVAAWRVHWRGQGWPQGDKLEDCLGVQVRGIEDWIKTASAGVGEEMRLGGE